MKNKLIWIILVVLAILIVSLAACVTAPEKKMEQAKEIIKQETIAENPLLFDNGKNFLVINSGDWAVAKEILQKWQDEHPKKELIFCVPGFDPNEQHPVVHWAYYKDKD